MAADQNSGLLQRLVLPPIKQAHWKDTLPDQLQRLRPGSLNLISHHWEMRCRDLSSLIELLQGEGFRIASLHTQEPLTAISAQALGLPVQLLESDPMASDATPSDDSGDQSSDIKPDCTAQLRLHRGTLRAGEQIETAGDLLVLGDVNPGANVAAAGDVMIWGRLRGIAHAGRDGDRSAKVVALQLRPLQLRIADQVARGPDDRPQPGLAEEARIDAGDIVIEPANPRLRARMSVPATD